MKKLLPILATCVLASCTYAPSKYVDKSISYTGERAGVEYVHDIPCRYETYQVRKVVTQTPFVRVGNPYGTSGSYGGGYYPIY